MSNEIDATIFLVRPGAVSEIASEANAAKLSLAINELSIAKLVPFEGLDAEPSWAPALRALISNGVTLASLNASSPGAILYCNLRSTIWFIVAFGSAHLRVKKSAMVADFGRRVAMNAVLPDSVLKTNTQQALGAKHQVLDRAPAPTTNSAFGLDPDRDILAALEGQADSTAGLGAWVAGARSLRLTTKLTDLGEVLSKAYRLYSNKTLAVGWEGFDNISLVSDPDTTQLLERNLEAALASNQTKELAFLPPTEFEMTDWRYVGLRPRAGHTPTHAPFLSLGTLRGSKRTLTVQNLRTTEVLFYDGNKQLLKDLEASAFDFASFETTDSQQQCCVLISGHWYRVNNDLIKRTNQIISNLKPPPLTFPQPHPNEDEGDYNIRAAGLLRLDCLDKANISYGSGHSRFEHCDIVDFPNKRMFFVKPFHQSSAPMSHLAEQVRNTTTNFFSADATYRTALNKKHPKFSIARPTFGDWALVLVVLGRPLSKLPFFAKLTLARVATDLSERGHTVLATAV